MPMATAGTGAALSPRRGCDSIQNERDVRLNKQLGTKCKQMRPYKGLKPAVTFL